MLDTLKGIKEVNKYNVIVMDELRDKYPELFNESGSMDYKIFEEKIRPNNFIYLRHDKNSISFTIQDGPLSKNKVNGCQVDEIITIAKIMLEGLNKKLPCRENSVAITKLDECLMWLEKRKKDRIKRDVEGTDEL